MDPTGCGEYLATDVAMDVSPDRFCTSSFVVFWMITAVLLVAKTATVARSWYIYYFKRFKAATKPAKASSVVIPFFHTALLINYTSASFLLGLNVANASNGILFVNFGINFFIVCLTLLSYLDKITRFHAKLSRRTHVEPLPRFVQGTYRIVLLFAIVVGAAAVLTLIALPPVFPAHLRVIGQAGFAGCAVFQATLATACIWQAHRCIRVVEKNANDDNLDVQRQRVKLRRRLYLLVALHGVLGYGSVLVQCLAASRLVSWSWWLLITFPSGAETFASFVTCFRVRLNKKERVLAIPIRQTPMAASQLQGYFQDGAASTIIEEDEVQSEIFTVVGGTHRIFEMEIEIGHETAVYYLFGPRIALKAAAFTSHPLVALSGFLYYLMFSVSAICYFSIREQCVHGAVLFPFCGFGLLLYLLFGMTRYSIPVVRKVLLTSAFWLRFTLFVVMFICLTDIIDFDDRISVLVMWFFGALSLLWIDGLISYSGILRRSIALLVLPQPFVCAALLQLDLVRKRKDTQVPILEFNGIDYRWSVYQIAMDLAYSLCFLYARDAWKALRNLNHFVFLTSPISVRIVKMQSTEQTQVNGAAEMQQEVDDEGSHRVFAVRDGSIVLGNNAFVDQIVLKEADAIGYKVLGKRWGGKWFKFLSNPWGAMLMKMNAFFSLVMIGLSLVGVVPHVVVFASVNMFISIFTLFSMKSWPMFKLLIWRSDFWVDFGFFTLVLVSAGFVLGDERVFAVAIFAFLAIHERTQDSRAVYFWESQKLSKDNLGVIAVNLSVVLLIVVALIAPLFFSLGLVDSNTKETTIQFRSPEPATNSTDDVHNLPQGTFARLRLIQFAANGLAGFCIYQLVSQFASLKYRLGFHGITMRWLAAPITKRFVEFCGDSENPAGVHPAMIIFPQELNAFEDPAAQARQPHTISLDLRRARTITIEEDVHGNTKRITRGGSMPAMAHLVHPGMDSPRNARIAPFSSSFRTPRNNQSSVHVVSTFETKVST